METNAHRAGTLAEYCYLRTVTAKILYIVVHPFESSILIEQALITRCILVIHIKEAEYVESILDAHVDELCFGNDYAWIVYF